MEASRESEFESSQPGGGSLEEKTDISSSSPSSTNTRTLAPNSGAKLFVGQLPRSYDSNMVSQLFRQCGTILEVTIIVNKFTGEHCGCAFVLFSHPDEARRAIELFDNKFALPPMKNPIQVRIANANHGTSKHSRSDGSRIPDKFNPNLHDPRKVFVSAFPGMDEDAIKKTFSQFGIIEEVTLLRSHFDGSPTGAIVCFHESDAALVATQSLVICHGTQLQLNVKWAKKSQHRIDRTSNNNAVYTTPYPMMTGGATGDMTSQMMLMPGFYAFPMQQYMPMTFGYVAEASLNNSDAMAFDNQNGKLDSRRESASSDPSSGTIPEFIPPAATMVPYPLPTEYPAYFPASTGWGYQFGYNP